jgi:predicted RNA-binding Zn-ribbon protein involved in translation (DUF1610 family)
MKPETKPRPLWRCPKCGKYYVTRHMWHACARHTVAEHFAGRDPILRSLFDGLVALLRRFGPVRIVPGKTGIAFQQRMRFASVFVRKNHLEAGFILPRRLDHARIKKVVAYSPHAYAHHVEIRSPADLDEELAGWLRETYRVGAQTDLLAGKKAPAPQDGDFAWSELSAAKAKRRRVTPEEETPASGRAKPARRRSPPWQCLKCGRTFATRNQMHICSRLSLDDALQGKSPRAVALFGKLVAMARRFGAVKIVPQKTRIALQARKSFLAVRFLREAIDCELALPRRIEHPRFRQILSASPGSHYHYLRIASAAELDRQVRTWLREAFRAAQITKLYDEWKSK